MITLKIKGRLKTKAYLKNLTTYTFESLTNLVFELFENHRHGQKEIFEIELLLTELGISNLKEIDRRQVDAVKQIIVSKSGEWKTGEDAELLTYRLLAAIKARSVITIIDDLLIENMEIPVSVTADSTISFVNNLKIDTLSFTTL